MKEESKCDQKINSTPPQEFVHKELGFFDVFANVKYGFYQMWYSLVKGKDDEKAHELAMGKLT